MVRTKQQRRFDRKSIDPAALVGPSPANVVSVTASDPSEVTIVFDRQVMLSSSAPPTNWTFGTANRQIVSLSSSDGITYVATLTGTAAAAEPYAMPAANAQARTTAGGYVAASSGTIAA